MSSSSQELQPYALILFMTSAGQGEQLSVNMLRCYNAYLTLSKRHGRLRLDNVG